MRKQKIEKQVQNEKWINLKAPEFGSYKAFQASNIDHEEAFELLCWNAILSILNRHELKKVIREIIKS